MAGLFPINLVITLLALGYQLTMTCYSLDYHLLDRSMSWCVWLQGDYNGRDQWCVLDVLLGWWFQAWKRVSCRLETKRVFFVCETLGEIITSLLFLFLRTDNSTPMNLGCRADFQSTMMEVYKQTLFSITNSFRLVCACKVLWVLPSLQLTVGPWK